MRATNFKGIYKYIQKEFEKFIALDKKQVMQYKGGTVPAFKFCKNYIEEISK